MYGGFNLFRRSPLFDSLEIVQASTQVTPAGRQNKKSYEQIYAEYSQACDALKDAEASGQNVPQAEAAFEKAHNALIDREERIEELSR